MPEAPEIHGTVFKNGSTTLLARVVGEDGLAVTQASLNAAEYSVYALDADDPDAAVVVAGHDGISVGVSSLMFDTLQTDTLWDVDTLGYNFRHVLDVSTTQAFTTAGQAYRIVFRLTPGSGQVVLVRFRVYAI